VGLFEADDSNFPGFRGNIILKPLLFNNWQGVHIDSSRDVVSYLFYPGLW
jgi:hypothetical protein